MIILHIKVVVGGLALDYIILKGVSNILSTLITYMRGISSFFCHGGSKQA